MTYVIWIEKVLERREKNKTIFRGKLRIYKTSCEGVG